ncbi:MAG TPA: acetoacetate decarboxylase family protein [Acidimicrobiales bacterium]|jgi:hypothetical protein|nr:acetoacetate decarboxylase family protein [Acidimicrobiales bacterium]
MKTYEIQGRTVAMPVEVRDASAGTAIFDVDAATAQAWLPGDAFEVVESAPGRAQLAVALIDYRDNDLGDYLEIGLTLFARPRGAGDDAAGTFIVHLPVDQEFTCEAGCRIWGFPKTVEHIVNDVTDDASRWRLEMDGQLVLDITVPRGGSDEQADMEMATYTYLDGAPHTTPFTQGGKGSQVVVGGDGVRLELGDHPIARALAGLGLPAPAVLSTWTEHMHGTFGEATPL